jgi:hypothetical protein
MAGESESTQHVVITVLLRYIGNRFAVARIGYLLIRGIDPGGDVA